MKTLGAILGSCTFFFGGRFIYFESERVCKITHAWEEGQRKRGKERGNMSQGGAERGRETIPSRLHATRMPDAGLDPMNCEIMT